MNDAESTILPLRQVAAKRRCQVVLGQHDTQGVLRTRGSAVRHP